MRRDQVLHLLAHGAAPRLGPSAVDEHAQRIDGLGVDEDRHLHEVAGAVFLEHIVEGRIALGDRFQPVIEVEHHFVQRQVVDHHRAGADVGELPLSAAAVLAELDDGAEILVRREDGRLDPRLGDAFDPHGIWHVGGVVQLDLVTVGQRDFIDHARGRRDQVEIELPAQALLNDLKVEKAQEPAAEAETEGGGGFHLVAETRVIQAQLAYGGAQVLEVGGVHGEETAEHHRLGVLEPAQRLSRRAAVVGDGRADGGVGDLLDRGGEEADLAGAKAVDRGSLGQKHAQPLGVIDRAGLHHLQLLAYRHAAFQHAD